MSHFDNEINRFDEMKLASYQNSAKLLAQDHFPYPKQITIFPTYRCNHTCPGCLYHCHEGYWKGEMSLENLYVIKETLQRISIQQIEISGGGDPGCHPYFRTILKELTKIASLIGLISHGAAFKEKDLITIVQNADYIRISLDSLNSETYRQIHGEKANLNKTLDNLNSLIDLKKKYNSKIAIGIKFLITRHNFSEVDKIIDWSKTACVDHIQFKSIRCAPSELPFDDLKVVDQKIQTAKKMNRSQSAIYGSLLPIEESTQCWTAPLSAVIDPLGDLYICCYYHERKDELRIGNIMDQKFEDLWGSEKHKKLMKSINMSHCTHDCRFKMYNSLLLKYVRGNREL